MALAVVTTCSPRLHHYRYGYLQAVSGASIWPGCRFECVARDETETKGSSVMHFIRIKRATLRTRRVNAPGSGTGTGTGPAIRALPAVALLLLSAAAAAQKPPTLIRQHLLEDPDMDVSQVKSVEPHRAEALDAVLSTGIWKVAYSKKGQGGESLVFMAVSDDGEVVRIRDFDAPASRENFVGLLRDDFRVQSVDQARQLVAATLELYFGFPFSEPEMTAEQMRAERRGSEYFFVDGERFGDATGYRIVTDAHGRVVAYEYSWALPVEPAED